MSARTLGGFPPVGVSFFLMSSASASPSAPEPESCTLPWASVSPAVMSFAPIGVPWVSCMPSLTAIWQRPRRS